jgi:hypothetical protein
MNFQQRTFRCSGHWTCLIDCKCKSLHHPYKKDDGQYCCAWDRGSCWHNHHSDGQPHEEFDELITEEELKNIKRTKLIDKILT